MKVWGHRGYSGVYPENTMLAFKKADECGAYGVELDVHLSSDGKLVIIHDESLKRTCGIDKMVEECTFDYLTKTTANLTHPEYEATIPSFEEFCWWLKGTDMKVNVELKTGVTWYRGIEKKTVDMIKAIGIEEKILFSSFNWLSVARCKALVPEIPCGLLFEKPIVVSHAALEAKDYGIEFIHPDYHLIDDQMAREAKESGVGINTWTVNTPEAVEEMKKREVDGIITNFPELALSLV